MKNLILLITIAFTFPLFGETLHEILDVYISNARGKEQCLLVGFESDQKIPAKNRSLQKIVAFNQSLEELQKLKALLKTQGQLIALYMPKDSQHREIVARFCGEAFPNAFLETNRYRIALKSLKMTNLSENLYKGIAHYPNKEVLLKEFKEKPSIWGDEMMKHTHLIPPEGNYPVGYRLLEFILVKRLSSNESSKDFQSHK